MAKYVIEVENGVLDLERLAKGDYALVPYEPEDVRFKKLSDDWEKLLARCRSLGARNALKERQFSKIVVALASDWSRVWDAMATQVEISKHYRDCLNAGARPFGCPSVMRIIFSPPATIVFWSDDTKTVVKCAADETYSEYNAFLAAVAKKVFGSNSRIKNEIKRKGLRTNDRPR